MTTPNTRRFRIEYKDPETGEPMTTVEDFTDEPGFATARELAEDMAYTIADKGAYTITEMQS